MSKSTQLFRRDATGVTYSHPEHPDFLVRIKTTKRAKSLDTLKTDNVKTEIIISDKNFLTKDNVTANDLMSVRISVSGSVLSHERLQAILTGVAGQLPAWSTENVILGYEPKTPPLVY